VSEMTATSIPGLHSTALAPVAQGIERCPPEAEVAGSNPAGRVERDLLSERDPPCRPSRARDTEGPCPSSLGLGAMPTLWDDRRRRVNSHGLIRDLAEERIEALVICRKVDATGRDRTRS
jgi:hypothetical protein